MDLAGGLELFYSGGDGAERIDVAVRKAVEIEGSQCCMVPSDAALSSEFCGFG